MKFAELNIGDKFRLPDNNHICVKTNFIKFFDTETNINHTISDYYLLAEEVLPLETNDKLLDYDKKNDILYIKIGDTFTSYGDEVQNGVVVLRSYESDNTAGITIFDFKKKFEELLND